jgi:hypothetical protein
MKNQFYFRCIDFIETNICDISENLLVNCTGLCVMDRGFRTFKPNGREDFYLQYQVSGNIKIWINGEVQIMRPGQFVLYYPKTQYKYEAESSNEIVY